MARFGLTVRGRTVLRIVGLYALFGSLWIYLSDSVLGWLIRDPATLTALAMYKGLLFIALTSLLLYALISRSAAHLAESARQIEQGELRFQSIFHGVSEALFIHDLEGRIEAVNQTACDLFGMSAAELVQSDVGTISEGVPPYSQAEALAALARTAAGEPQRFEWRCRRRPHEVFWGEVRMRRADFGQGGHIIASVRDISERKRSEVALHETHRLLENLAQEVPGVLFQAMVDPQGRISTTYTSQKVAEVFGADDGSLGSEVIWGRFAAGDGDRVLAGVREAARTGGRWEAEYRIEVPGGGDRWIYGTAQSLPGPGGQVDLFGILMDVTQRKEAEERLRFSEAKFATAFRATPDSMNLTRQRDGCYLEVNEGFLETTGYRLEEVLGKTALELNIWVDPSDRERLVRDLAAQGIVKDLEAEFRRKDGSTLLGHMSACLIDLEGERYILSVTRDITEREKSRQELLKMQKLESLGVLAGGIAHDFNNILTGILGNISFARHFLTPSDRAQGILVEAEAAAGRAKDLAQQLLTFAKGGDPVRKAVAVAPLLTAAASLALRGKGVDHVLDIPEGLPPLEADEGQLHQVFNNLFLNAVQAMPQGGKVTVRVGPGAGPYLRFEVTDTGTGMDAEVQRRIFEPYFTTKAGGSGLGLASVYSIITRHQGQIAVRSAPGQGTTFEILLPVRSPDPSPPVQANPGPTSAGRRGPVLVMDDEAMIRSMAAQMLSALGYKAETCADGAEAVNLYAQALDRGEPFLAVILDLTVPSGMGGREAASRILALDPQAVLLVSSGYSPDPAASPAGGPGFRASVAKPYTLDSLARTLRQAIEGPSPQGS